MISVRLPGSQGKVALSRTKRRSSTANDLGTVTSTRSTPVPNPSVVVVMATPSVPSTAGVQAVRFEPYSAVTVRPGWVPERVVRRKVKVRFVSSTVMVGASWVDEALGFAGLGWVPRTNSMRLSRPSRSGSASAAASGPARPLVVAQVVKGVPPVETRAMLLESEPSS